LPLSENFGRANQTPAEPVGEPIGVIKPAGRVQNLQNRMELVLEMEKIIFPFLKLPEMFDMPRENPVRRFFKLGHFGAHRALAFGPTVFERLPLLTSVVDELR